MGQWPPFRVGYSSLTVIQLFPSRPSGPGSRRPVTGPAAVPRRPTRLSPSYPGPMRPRTGRGRIRTNRPLPTRSPPIGSNLPRANKRPRLERTSPGSRKAGSHQLHGIGPHNGRRPCLAFGSGRSTTATASFQPGSRNTESSSASSAAQRPPRTESSAIRSPFANLLGPRVVWLHCPEWNRFASRSAGRIYVEYARQELNLQPLAPEAPKSDSQKAV
jgi:hypothetical protein